MESLRGLSSSPASAYDELVTGQKSIRYHWQGILSVIRALPGGGLSERVESARRQLEESGATVNLLGDRGKPSWHFDPLHRTTAPVPFFAKLFVEFAKKVTCPVLYVSGGPRGYHPPDEAERLSAFSTLERAELPEAGHMAHWTEPAALTPLLLEHLRAAR